MMINNLTLYISLSITLICTSCSTSRHFTKPLPEDLPFNQYGAQINIEVSPIYTPKIYEGEIIAADSHKVVVLLDPKFRRQNLEVKEFGLDDILKYKITYARTDISKANTLTTINSVISISHGFIGLLTIPINLVVGYQQADAMQSQFRLTQKKFNKYEMNLFARFPQGVPSNVSANNYLLLTGGSSIKVKLGDRRRR